MNYKSTKHRLSGTIIVPGSKSHTIRALLLAALADGVSNIKNPLPSADCLSAAHAIKAFGAKVDIGCPVDEKGIPQGTPAETWVVTGAGKNAHLPDCQIDVGNSGSTLYFFTPVAATFSGKSSFTGDESICKRPVNHLLDALRQLGAEACTDRVGVDAPPFSVTGPIKAGSVTTDGRLSQYISGLMMASLLIDGELDINLTDPKEVPYLTMTQLWLKNVGVDVDISPDYKKIKTHGKKAIKAFDTIIPSDWEGVAFPLMAAILSGSDIVIDGIDTTGSQGDDAIVEILKSLGADLMIEKLSETSGRLIVNGSKSQNLSTKRGNFKDDILRVNIASFPDAVCALAALSCFVDGTVILEDTEVCRKKETDRIKVMVEELSKLGGNLVDGLTLPQDNPLFGDQLIIYGNKDALHGGTVESYDDHRVAMSLACFGLALENDSVTVKDGECCSVSFPGFFEKMNELGAGFLGIKITSCNFYPC